MASIERKTKRYPTDLTDAEWTTLAPFLPKPAKRGRRPGVDMREIVNAIRYMTRSGGGWRMLPKDFPPWQTVYWWFRRFVRLMLFKTIHNVAKPAPRRVSSTAKASKPLLPEPSGALTVARRSPDASATLPSTRTVGS
jgi:transposase